MIPPGPGTYRPEGFSESPSWFHRFLEQLNPFTQYLSNQLNGALTIDNEKSKLTTQKLSHGVPLDIANPFTTKPLDVIAVSTDTTLPKPQIDWTFLQSGKLRVTAYYPLPEQFIYLRQTSTAQTINTTGTTVTFDASPIVSVGSNITYDGTSTLTFKVAGRYAASYKIILGSPGTATLFQTYISSGGQEWGRQQIGPLNSASNPTLSGSAIIKASVGDTAFAVAGEVGGAVATASLATTGSYMELTQLSYDSTAAANVTLKIVGV